MYPRLIRILRANANPSVGAQEYSSMVTAGETVIFTNLAAEVQMKRRAGQPDAGLPADAQSLMSYDVFIPAYSLDRTARLRIGDIVQDDLGIRYLVMGSYWNVLGWKLTTSILEN